MLQSNKAEDMNEYFEAMTAGKPYKTYKKTILGKVYVHVLSMLTGTPTPEGIILEGDPRKNDPNSMIDIWSKMEDYFFRKMNKRHLADRVIVEFSKKDEVKKEKTVDDMTDEELKAVIVKPFYSIKAILDKTNSIATLFTIRNLAEELEKSEKVMKAIDSRISEVQEAKTPQMPSEIEEEL